MGEGNESWETFPSVLFAWDGILAENLIPLNALKLMRNPMPYFYKFHAGCKKKLIFFSS